MDAVAALVGRIIDGLLYPFEALPEWAGLLLFSALSGIGILWVFGRLTNQARLQRARDRMAAAVYEVRIFFDSPRRIVSSQLRLLYGSLEYTLFTLPSLVVLSLPLALLWVHLDANHGLAALDAKAPLVVRVVLGPGVDPKSVRVVTEGSIAPTAPPVFVASTRELYTRLAPPGDAREIKIQAGDRVVTKQLSTNPKDRFVSAERASGMGAFVAVGHEPPIPSSAGVEKVSLHHGTRDVRLLVAAPWWVHWLVISTVFALAARKRLGVVI